MMRNPTPLVLLLALTAATPRSPLPEAAGRVAALVVAKAPHKLVAVVARPETAQSLSTPSHVAAVRTAVSAALVSASQTVADGSDADRTLRDTGVVGLPNAAALRAVATAAKADGVLCLVLRRSSDADRLTAYVVLDGRAVAQLAVTLDPKSMTPADAPSDVDQAATAVAAAVAPAVASCAAQASAARVATVVLCVRPQTPADAGTAGFEVGMYDALAKSLAESNLTVTPLASVSSKGSPVRPTGPVLPAAVAQLNLPAGSAVMTATYARRPGGRVVKLSVVTPATTLAAATATVDEWDAAAFPPYPVLNTRVLAFAQAQVGKKVGNGECWTLAADALTDAHAHPADGYTFGRKLAPGETPYPGDIFQFTTARFEGHTGGATWWKTLGSPNHTAVVRRVLGPTKFEILEQNPGPVATDTIDFKDLKSGTWELWRPQG